MQKKRLAHILFVSAAACLTLLLTLSAAAQGELAEIPKNEFGFWSGASPDSSTIFGMGRTAEVRYGTIALRYARRFNNNRLVNLKYTVDAIPFTLLSAPDFRFIKTEANSLRAERERRTTRAFGLAPLGLQVNFRPRQRVQPFINSSGGLLYFDKRIPAEFGTHLAFTADLGGGLEFQVKNNRAVTIGYKYLHVSNANRGITNPGFDNNLFYVGYSFSR